MHYVNILNIYIFAGTPVVYHMTRSFAQNILVKKQLVTYIRSIIIIVINYSMWQTERNFREIERFCSQFQ